VNEVSVLVPDARTAEGVRGAVSGEVVVHGGDVAGAAGRARHETVVVLGPGGTPDDVTALAGRGTAIGRYRRWLDRLLEEPPYAAPREAVASGARPEGAVVALDKKRPKNAFRPHVATAAVADFGLMFLAGDLLSGLLAWTAAYLLWPRPDDGLSRGRRAGRALTVVLMALFLRGGVRVWGGNAAAALAGALVVHAGFSLYVFPQRPLGWRAAEAGLLAYAPCLMLANAGAVGLMPVEAYYWCWAQHLDWGYLDHPPMVAWLAAAGTAVFGDNAFGVRAPAIACWAAAAFFAHRFARDLYGRGLLAAALVAALPYFVGAGFLLTPDAPLLACWAAALHFLGRIFVAHRPRAWWGLGAAVGLGRLSKYSMAFLLPAILVLMIADRRWWRRPEPYAAGALAVLIFSPVLLWNAAHGWASLAFQSTRRMAEAFEFSAHVQLLASVAWLTPLGVRALLTHREEAPARRRLLRAAVWVPFAIVLGFSLLNRSKANWTGPLWLGALPALACSIRRWPRRWGANVSVVVCLLGGVLYYFAAKPPGARYPDNLRTPAGWRALSEEVARLEETVDDPVIVGVDRYFISSQLLFHDPSREVAGRHLFRRESLMWKRWSDPQDYAGRNLILVGQEEKEFDNLLGHYAELSPIFLVRMGNEGRFYYRILKGYVPPR